MDTIKWILCMFQCDYKLIKELSDLWIGLYWTRRTTKDFCRDSEYRGIYKHENATPQALWAEILLFNKLTSITNVDLKPTNVQNGQINFLWNQNRCECYTLSL